MFGGLLLGILLIWWDPLDPFPNRGRRQSAEKTPERLQAVVIGLLHDGAPEVRQAKEIPAVVFVSRRAISYFLPCADGVVRAYEKPLKPEEIEAIQAGKPVKFVVKVVMEVQGIKSVGGMEVPAQIELKE